MALLVRVIPLQRNSLAYCVAGLNTSPNRTGVLLRLRCVTRFETALVAKQPRTSRRLIDAFDSPAGIQKRQRRAARGDVGIE